MAIVEKKLRTTMWRDQESYQEGIATFWRTSRTHLWSLEGREGSIERKV